MWVKICANTNVDDARLAADLGADALGFVFAPSKRQVTAEQVAEILPQLPAKVMKVGVFTCDDADEIAAVMEIGLDAVQLHCMYSAALVRKIAEAKDHAVRIIQMVPYDVDAANRADTDARFEAALRLVMTDENVWAVLVDVARGGVSGGLGIAFNPEHVGKIVQRASRASKDKPRVILAGGLTPESVHDSAAAFGAWGVDVASGVEARPGRKDADKLAAFIAAAKRS